MAKTVVASLRQFRMPGLASFKSLRSLAVPFDCTIAGRTKDEQKKMTQREPAHLASTRANTTPFTVSPTSAAYTKASLSNRAEKVTAPARLPLSLSLSLSTVKLNNKQTLTGKTGIGMFS